MNPALTVAGEFGLDGSSVAGSASAGPEPSSPLASITSAASGHWWDHPGVALAVLVFGGAGLIAHSTPLASASGHVRLGKAAASAGGEV